MFHTSLGENILNTFSRIGIGNVANVSRVNLVVGAHFLSEREKQSVKQYIHKERVKLDRTRGIER